MKILLADKDTEVLEVTTYALRRYGFDVIAVRDGVQALRCWKETAPDLVLVEIDLPQLNGFELCREIRQHSTTPVIMVSARTDDEEVVQGFNFGADGLRGETDQSSSIGYAHPRHSESDERSRRGSYSRR